MRGFMTFAFTIVLVLATWSVQAGVYHFFVLSMFSSLSFRISQCPKLPQLQIQYQADPGHQQVPFECPHFLLHYPDQLDGITGTSTSPTNGITTVITETFVNPPYTLTITSVIPAPSLPLTILSTMKTGPGPVSPHFPSTLPNSSARSPVSGTTATSSAVAPTATGAASRAGPATGSFVFLMAMVWVVLV